MKRLITLLAAAAVLAGSVQAAELAPLPIVTGDFIQPWQFEDMSQRQITAHFEELAEVGIKYVIITEVARLENGRIVRSYYPASPSLQAPSWNYTDKGVFAEQLFTAAEETGIKIFMGLGYDRLTNGGWWSNNFPFNPSWYRVPAETGNLIAKELHDQFKSRFPDTFHGWYFVYEFFNNLQGQAGAFADFVNINRDFLYELDPSMPFLISPFFANDHKTPADTKTELIQFFNLTNFKPGDIYAPQDCVGVGRTTVPQSAVYFRHIREAIDESSKPWLTLWANNENFVGDPPNGLAPVDRLLSQIAATGPYVEGHITFSYSHFYASIVKGPTAHHNIYREYFQSVIADIDFGDVDQSGVIDAADVTLLRRYLAAGDNKDVLLGEFPAFRHRNADVNFDNKINADDVTLLRRYIAAFNPAAVTLGPRRP